MSMASLLFPDLLDLLVLDENLTKNLRLNISELRLVDKASIHKFFPEIVKSIKRSADVIEAYERFYDVEIKKMNDEKTLMTTYQCTHNASGR